MIPLDNAPATLVPASPDEHAFKRDLLAMNEALLVSSVRQHELVEQAQQADAAARASEERLRRSHAELTAHSHELSRFNRVAVERELRIIELKKEVNELRLQKGEAARFPLEFERDNLLANADSSDGNSLSRDIPVPLEAIVCTDERAVTHESPPGSRQFDAEDLRKVESLGRFASAAYQSTGSASAFEQRRAALSLMEDAVESRQRVEKLNTELRESEIRYRRLFESAKDGILILDADDGTVIDANSFLSDLLGYSRDECVGKELWEIGLFRDRMGSEAAVRELRETGYVHYEHLPLETKLSQRVDAEVIANTYRVDQLTVIQCNIRDITERSRLEQKTLEQAEALTDLHRRKDEFLAMLSHELRNPLAPILNAVQLLGFNKDEGTTRQRARQIIERQVGQLTRLVDDLMEISRINTGRIHLHLERVALNAILERGVETVRPLIERCQHTLEVSRPSQPIWVDGDAARLEQVVVNLLTNAAKYTNGGGQIWLGVEQEGDEAVLRVKDTGVGISPELLPRIFDLFTQAERSLDRSQGGLGIGLSLVQRLVEMHRGTVAVYSVLGQGSEFIVRLPAFINTSPQPRTPVEALALSIASIRVLVVDDNADAAMALEMLLKAAGHAVRTAHDGPTALNAALEFRPNVVLLDIGLPGISGYEVAKRLRLQAGHQNLVLVALTGYGQEADRQHSMESGFDHHLVKPPDFRKLQQILESASKRAT